MVALTRAVGRKRAMEMLLTGKLVNAATAAEWGLINSAVPAADLPYVLMRIMESYIYLSLITGDEPDAARASSVIHALLPGH